MTSACAALMSVGVPGVSTRSSRFCATAARSSASRSAWLRAAGVPPSSTWRSALRAPHVRPRGGDVGRVRAPGHLGQVGAGRADGSVRRRDLGGGRRDALLRIVVKLLVELDASRLEIELRLLDCRPPRRRRRRVAPAALPPRRAGRASRATARRARSLARTRHPPARRSSSRSSFPWHSRPSFRPRRAARSTHTPPVTMRPTPPTVTTTSPRVAVTVETSGALAVWPLWAIQMATPISAATHQRRHGEGALRLAGDQRRHPLPLPFGSAVCGASSPANR